VTKVSIEPVDPRDERATKDITRLHMELLAHGPMARLGFHFMHRFCYTRLFEAGLLRAVLARVDDEAVGFLSYTEKSITFHRDAISKHLPAVVAALVVSILREPKVLLRIPKAVWLMFDRRGELALGEEPLGEVVSIGAKAEFLKPRFVRETGVVLSEDMLRHAADDLRRLGATRLRMVVEAHNRPALFFYSRLGAKLEPYAHHGTAMTHVWFDLTRDLLPEDAA